MELINRGVQKVPLDGLHLRKLCHGQIGIGTIQRLVSNVMFKGEVWLKAVLISFPNQHPRFPTKKQPECSLSGSTPEA